MRVLLIKLGAIGDIVHTLPSLAAIKRQRPDVHITWAVERRSAEIIRGNPLIDRILELDTRAMREGSVVEDILPEVKRQIAPLRDLEFDVAIDFQGLLKSGLVAKLSGATQRWGFSRRHLREPASRIFLNRTVRIDGRSHVVRKNLALAEAVFGPFPQELQLEFPISTNKEHKAEADQLIEDAGAEIALLNPAGGWVTKLWHAEKYGQLADRIWEDHGLRPVVVTGPAETEIAERVLTASRSGKVITAEPTLKGFYELAKRARIYIGGDTGPTHIAVAAATPIVGIFGPTEWWRNGSPNKADLCVERLDIECRIDCHRRTCSNWICMDIPPESVLRAVAERLRPIKIAD